MSRTPSIPLPQLLELSASQVEVALQNAGAQVERLANSVAAFAKLGTEPMSMTPAEGDAFIRHEYEDLGKVMRAAGLTPQ